MEQYVITRETMVAAKSYLPITKKMEFLDHASECFDRLSITNGNDPMPPMWKENAGLKARYLLAALLHFYLEEPTLVFEDAEHFLISEETFDKFASSHPIMQIERFKRDKDESIRNKAYDLLADYFQLEKAFNAEIRSMLDVQNDMVVRQQLLNKMVVQELPAILPQLQELMSKWSEANGA